MSVKTWIYTRIDWCPWRWFRLLLGYLQCRKMTVLGSLAFLMLFGMWRPKQLLSLLSSVLISSWVRNGSALPAGDGIGSAATPGNFVHQEWVVSCTVRSLQHGECPSHCERHQVQAKPKLVCLGRLRGDSYVEARDLQSPWERQAANDCGSTWNVIFLRARKSMWPHGSLLRVPLLGPWL